MIAQDIVDILNHALALDPVAIHDLIGYRVPCNTTLANHSELFIAESVNVGTCVGLLGMINAFLARDGRLMEAVFDDQSGQLIEFRLRPQQVDSLTQPIVVSDLDQFPLADNV